MSTPFDIVQADYSRFTFERDDRVLTASITSDHPVNGVDAAMHEELGRVFTDLQRDSGSDIIILTGKGRAFCAGGDIRDLHRGASTGDFEHLDRYFRTEYSLNYAISKLETPLLSLWDGIVMGGGVGVSSHGSHRIVTERTVLAMPECAIGFLPDVGGTWIMRNAPGNLGKFISMTGLRLNADDAIYTGFADYLVREKVIEKGSDRFRNSNGRLGSAVVVLFIKGMQPGNNHAPSLLPAKDDGWQIMYVAHQ